MEENCPPNKKASSDKTGKSFPQAICSWALTDVNKLHCQFVLCLSQRLVTTGAGGESGNYTNIPDTHLHSVHL